MLTLRNDARKSLGAWVVASFALNLPWEIAHVPLYSFPADAGWLVIGYDILHCTAGDVLIALCIFLLASVGLYDLAWINRRPWSGAVLAAVMGVTYTAYSEYLNVHVRQSWAYSSLMPLIFGLGLSPLLQWLVLPFGVTYLARRLLSSRPPV
jgi:hypothetical protein